MFSKNPFKSTIISNIDPGLAPVNHKSKTRSGEFLLHCGNYQRSTILAEIFTQASQRTVSYNIIKLAKHHAQEKGKP